MKLKNKYTGEIFTLQSGVLHATRQEGKYAPAQDFNFAINIDADMLSSFVGVGQFADFELYTDEWAFDTAFRCFISKEQISQIALSHPEVISAASVIRRVEFANGVELYFDTIEEETFAAVLNSVSIEPRPNI